jgi:hypothetical protein
MYRLTLQVCETGITAGAARAVACRGSAVRSGRPAGLGNVAVWLVWRRVRDVLNDKNSTIDHDVGATYHVEFLEEARSPSGGVVNVHTSEPWVNIGHEEVDAACKGRRQHASSVRGSDR